MLRKREAWHRDVPPPRYRPPHPRHHVDIMNMSSSHLLPSSLPSPSLSSAWNVDLHGDLLALFILWKDFKFRDMTEAEEKITLGGVKLVFQSEEDLATSLRRVRKWVLDMEKMERSAPPAPAMASPRVVHVRPNGSTLWRVDVPMGMEFKFNKYDAPLMAALRDLFLPRTVPLDDMSAARYLFVSVCDVVHGCAWSWVQ